MRILAVDDDPGVRELVRDFLGSRGYQVDTASDGPTALAEIERRPPDLLLVDLMMPGMNGLEVLRLARIKRPELPVIVMTALAEDEIGRNALESGALDYVTKPIDLKYLETTIGTALIGKGA